VQNVIGILKGIALNMWVAFGSMTIFTMLILLIHHHGRSFHLLKSSLISLFSSLEFSLKSSFLSFVKFILWYFIVFETIVDGIISLISFSVCALLVYKKAADFCMFVLCPATLLKEFMISIIFLVVFGVS
jgi:hypothetical protein